MHQRPAEFLAAVLQCVRDCEESGLLFEDETGILDGLSGLKTIGALQRFCRLFQNDTSACYLEVGVFQGLSLLSVATNFPDLSCFGVDNFSILDPNGQNLEIVNSRIARLEAENVMLVNQDFEDALKLLPDYIQDRKIAVYFVDGAHDYRSQLVSLLLAQNHLHENAIIIVDDANYEFVRQSTKDFLSAFPDFKLLFEAYSPAHPANLPADELQKWEQGWLNGVNILVRDPAGLLPDMVPPVNPDRRLYVNDWLVHRHQFAALAPAALDLAQQVCGGSDNEPVTAKNVLKDQYEGLRDELGSLEKDRNTFSRDLTEGRLNALNTP